VKDYDGVHKLWREAHIVGSPTKFVRNMVIFKELRKLVPGATLDAGCGIGEYSLFLAKNGHKVTAFDPSSFAINTLMEMGGIEMGIVAQVNTIEGFHHYRKFDNIVSIEVIEHIKSDQAAIRKLYSLLEKGGTLLMSTPALNFLFGEADRVSGHFRRYSYYGFRKIFFKAGFTKVSIRSYGFPLIFIYTLVRRLFFERAVIKHFSNVQPKTRVESASLSKLYPLVLAIDQLNIPLLGIGYVAVCKK
jgi:SAM-dependent methyltransferase